MLAKLLFLLNGIVCSTDEYTSTYVEWTKTYCADFHHVICAVGVYNDDQEDGDSVCCTATGNACLVLDECPTGSWHTCDAQEP